MYRPSWKVKLKMQLWIDCSCTVHIMDLKTANALEENTCSATMWDHSWTWVLRVPSSLCAFLIICLLTWFYLCTLAEVLFFKTASLSVFLVDHCIEVFFWWYWTQERAVTSSKLHKICCLCLMNVTIQLKIFLLSTMYLALIWEVEVVVQDRFWVDTDGFLLLQFGAMSERNFIFTGI